MEEQDRNYEVPITEQEHIEEDLFLDDVQWMDVELDKNWLDPTEHYVRPKYTLSFKGVPFAPLGGIHGLTGQPGHGKTFTFTQLMVAILKGEWYCLRYELRREIPEPKVLYIDTEMEKGNTQLVMLRVYQMMEWPAYTQQDRFKILWLREEVKAEDRWKKTLKAIHDMKPTVVFLDGLIDVVGDFNDNKECQRIIYQCMKTASHYGISMWCLLHENPGSEKMVGHVGSFLERKSTDVLKVKKDKGATDVIFSVEQKKARSRDLDKWQFVIDDDEKHYGHPRILSTEPIKKEQPEEMTKDDIMNAVSCIGTEQNVSFTKLRDKVRNHVGVGSDKARTIIYRATQLGILIENNKLYSANPVDLFEVKDDQLPF